MYITVDFTVKYQYFRLKLLSHPKQIINLHCLFPNAIFLTFFRIKYQSFTLPPPSRYTLTLNVQTRQNRVKVIKSYILQAHLRIISLLNPAMSSRSAIAYVYCAVTIFNRMEENFQSFDILLLFNHYFLFQELKTFIFHFAQFNNCYYH